MSEKLRPLLDLRVSVTGGVHFDLVKRVLRDIHRAGQEPEEIIQQISETVSSLLFSNLSIQIHFQQPSTIIFMAFFQQVYPMYKAFIEPDLKTAHIKIINKFNPFAGFQNPTYVLKVQHFDLLSEFHLYCDYATMQVQLLGLISFEYIL